jgi:hypothetical protein
VTTAAVFRESKLGLAEAARLLPSLRQGKPVNPATLTRWIIHGVSVAGGGRLRLEGVKVGHTWVTSAEAIERFLARQTAAALGEPEGAAVPTAGHGEAVERRLDSILGPSGAA